MTLRIVFTNRMRFMAKVRKDGSYPPSRFYALAYYSPERSEEVWYPIGIHLLVQLRRWAGYFWADVRFWQIPGVYGYERDIRRALNRVRMKHLMELQAAEDRGYWRGYNCGLRMEKIIKGEEK